VAIAANKETEGDTKFSAMGICGVIIVLQLVWAVIFSVNVVDAREIGIIKTFGRITGQTECDEDRSGVLRCGGLTIIAPWQTLDTYNIREQYIFADGIKCSNGTDRCLDSGDNQQQDVFITPKVNIKVDPDNVQFLAAEVGHDYITKIIRPRMLSVIKSVTSEYSSIDIHLKRTEVENKIKDRLQKEYDKYSIEVTLVSFENIAFSAEYNKGIELKAIAIQKALEEENRIAVIQAQAKQAKEEAIGRADALKAEAEGQAEANRLINASLTPLLIQFQALQKLADNVQIAIIPSGQGIIIDPATLLQPRPAQ
jgi:regulator of protease activity HflC (stomatin/prohibitin superfamily)